MKLIVKDASSWWQHIKSVSTMGQFLIKWAQLLRPMPNFLTAFSGEEVERLKHFLALNIFTRKKTILKLGAGRNSWVQVTRN